MATIADVRQHPGMYCDGVVGLVVTLLDDALARGCTRIDVRVEADGAIAIDDDGAGLACDGEALVAALTTNGGPGMYARGPMVVNALAARFEVCTVRDGRETRIGFARGELRAPPRSCATTRAAGVCVAFLPDAAVPGGPRVPRVGLSRRLEDLAFLLPEVAIGWAFAGDAAAAGGLAARVALAAGCAPVDVAHHRGQVDGADGAVAIEVALAWAPGPGSPQLDSFVNRARTVGGTHLDGVLEAAHAFVGGSRRAATAGLCAAVALALDAPALSGLVNPRLTTPAARAIAKAATLVALAAWAARDPQAVAARRARIAADLLA